jgi:hypothetical protein
MQTYIGDNQDEFFVDCNRSRGLFRSLSLSLLLRAGQSAQHDAR